MALRSSVCIPWIAVLALGLGAGACQRGQPSSATPTDEASAERPSSEGPSGEAAAQGPIIDHAVRTLDGKDASMADFRGKAVLVVNTASECGYTPQYEGLEKLWQAYKDRGLVVVGFPSNDFGHQEPGTPEEIKKFTEETFGISFPLMEKVHAKGDGIAPLYKTLSEETPPGIRGEVRWNFTKFLIAPDGHVVGRFEPKVTPDDATLVQAIERHLPKAKT